MVGTMEKVMLAITVMMIRLDHPIITSPVMTGRVRKRPEAAPGMRLC